MKFKRIISAEIRRINFVSQLFYFEINKLLFFWQTLYWEYVFLFSLRNCLIITLPIVWKGVTLTELIFVIPPSLIPSVRLHSPAASCWFIINTGSLLNGSFLRFRIRTQQWNETAICIFCFRFGRNEPNESNLDFLRGFFPNPKNA